MADLNDASGARRRRDRQRELLKSAAIDERDRDAIDRYVRHRRVHGAENGGDYAANTETNDLSTLRLSAERAAVALVDMGLDDLNELLDTLTAPKAEGGYGISSGIDAYHQRLKPFFRWLDVHEDFGAYPWHEQIRTGTVDHPKPSERTFPTQGQIDAMIEAARRQNNPRNAALVSFLADTAVRRTLCAQLRVGDVSLAGDRPTFQPNPGGIGQKDVEIKPYPLYDCVANLRTWVRNYHPDPHADDGPLWTVDRYDPDRPADCALSVSSIKRILNTLAEAAGIPDEVEIKPHAFRHAAVGRWKERGYSLAQVQRRTAWQDSAAAEMWGRYGDPDDAAVDALIDEIEGRDPPEDTVDGTADPVERYDCGTCGATGWATDHCGQCGAAVSPAAKAAATTVGDVQQEIAETLAALDPNTATEVAATLQQLADEETRAEINRETHHD